MTSALTALYFSASILRLLRSPKDLSANFTSDMHQMSASMTVTFEATQSTVSSCTYSAGSSESNRLVLVTPLLP